MLMYFMVRIEWYDKCYCKVCCAMVDDKEIPSFLAAWKINTLYIAENVLLVAK